jgi:acyl-CoA synthetase (AMP-forming)/AMP-acid ligase II
MSTLIRSFARDFEELVKTHADTTALLANQSPCTLTYADLNALMDRCLCLFRQRGLQPGDPILALMPNAVETVVLFLAALKGGYGFAPLPCRATPREIADTIELVRPRLCVAAETVEEGKRQTVQSLSVPMQTVAVDASFSWLPSSSGTTGGGAAPRIYLATSGTTGDPKSIVLDGDRLWSSGRAFMQHHGLEHAGLRFWNYLPMSYLGGLFNLCLIPLSTGGSTVIDEQFSGKTFLEFWQTLERFEINAVWFVPTIVRGLLNLADRFSPSELKHRSGRIKAAFVGTAPIELAVKRRFEELFGVKMFENFALSETTFFTSETTGDLPNRSDGSVGSVLPYASLKFTPAGDDSRLTEIHVKSPYLFLGYLGQDGRIQNPCDADGYLPTGDLGHLDGHQVLIVDGRKRDIIKRGGNYVALREIEVLAEQHPAVREAVAVRVAHDFYGESYILFVLLQPGYGDRAVADVSRFLHERAAQYKWPEKIVIKDEFPRTAGGKIKKHLLV